MELGLSRESKYNSSFLWPMLGMFTESVQKQKTSQLNMGAAMEGKTLRGMYSMLWTWAGRVSVKNSIYWNKVVYLIVLSICGYHLTICVQ